MKADGSLRSGCGGKRLSVFSGFVVSWLTVTMLGNAEARKLQKGKVYGKGEMVSAAVV